MATLIYTSMFNAWAKGNIDFDTDTFKVSLHTSSYTPDKDTHDFFDDATNEHGATGNYTAGGNTVTVTVNAVDTANDRQDITLGGSTWPTSTITARQAVYRKARGGAASADELIGVNDFGADFSSTSDTFTLNASTLRIDNS